MRILKSFPLLILLLAVVACGGSDENIPDADEFVFTAEDVERVRELVMREGSGAVIEPYLVLEEEPVSEEDAIPVLDLSAVPQYKAIRQGVDSSSSDLYRVTNTYLNMRADPRVTAEQTGTLNKGDVVIVEEFVDARWAKVRLLNGREGYVSANYIAKLVSEGSLADEKAAFDGLYFVNFGFLNVRKEPDSASEKIGELPGQSIVKPISTDDVWARVPFEGREAYVAVQYLKPFLPNFLVRQDEYTLPILHYRVLREGAATDLARHIDLLQQQDVTFLTMRDFADVLMEQEERDVRLSPRSTVIALSGLTGGNLKEVTDVLRASGVSATLFIQTEDLGPDKITDQMLLTMSANGFDIQSASHTGDDLRSLTNAQAKLELEQSRQILQKRTGKDVFAVAYPLGGTNTRIEDVAAEAGYLLGVSNAPESTFSRTQLLRLPSYQVSKQMEDNELVSIVVGDN